ncbi:hypothetical protein AYI69_g6493 [Smittium culicis]|uniref:Uncharacterized protein n=1 Tax=Smittium culicis TaxID=133412 RepID=A0A1R1XZ03_9FUNG|nr:hypothetical protein AYI69_g6493 [Smittium culicis]
MTNPSSSAVPKFYSSFTSPTSPTALNIPSVPTSTISYFIVLHLHNPHLPFRPRLNYVTLLSQFSHFSSLRIRLRFPVSHIYPPPVILFSAVPTSPTTSIYTTLVNHNISSILHIH